MRAKDWSQSPLGAAEGWSPVRRSFLAMTIAAKQPMFIAWGPGLSFLYNEAHAPILGYRHPWALGLPFSEAWSDIWPQFAPVVEATLAGEAQAFEDMAIPMTRCGQPDMPFISFFYTRLRDEAGKVAGLFCIAAETTAKVAAEREVAAEKNQLRTPLEQAPGFLCLPNGPEHVFEMMNTAHLPLVGHRDLTGKPVRKALPDVVGQGYFERVDRVYELPPESRTQTEATI